MTVGEQGGAGAGAQARAAGDMQARLADWEGGEKPSHCCHLCVATTARIPSPHWTVPPIDLLSLTSLSFISSCRFRQLHIGSCLLWPSTSGVSHAKPDASEEAQPRWKVPNGGPVSPQRGLNSSFPCDSNRALLAETHPNLLS